ncbi:MAG: DinB family protein [Pseudonocardia sp.]|nr:DinB family protein [Pseudonocardia sp.]
MPSDPKDVLTSYLQGARDTLIWKLDGLSEHDQRLPRTPTGMNLLGIVKHALHTEVTYFGPTFGRVWPTPGELVPVDEPDRQADWYATAQESSAGIVHLYRRVQRFADETIDALPLDGVGHVAHWGGVEVTLHQIMVHTTVDLQRHAGQADIVREQIDGSTGLLRHARNLPDDTNWPAYVSKLTALAERFRAADPRRSTR